MTTNLPVTAKQPPRLTLELHRDNDGRFRWYEMGTDTAAEVCPAADTPTEAWKNAAAVWRGTAWNLKHISPTVCEIDKDCLLPLEIAQQRLEDAADPDEVILQAWGE